MLFSLKEERAVVSRNPKSMIFPKMLPEKLFNDSAPPAFELILIVLMSGRLLLSKAVISFKAELDILTYLN
jgi:hypothetical protein